MLMKHITVSGDTFSWIFPQRRSELEERMILNKNNQIACNDLILLNDYMVH